MQISPCCNAEVTKQSKLEEDGSTCYGCEGCGVCWFVLAGKATDSVREIAGEDGMEQSPRVFLPCYKDAIDIYAKY